MAAAFLIAGDPLPRIVGGRAHGEAVCHCTLDVSVLGAAKRVALLGILVEAIGSTAILLGQLSRAHRTGDASA